MLFVRMGCGEVAGGWMHITSDWVVVILFSVKLQLNLFNGLKEKSSVIGSSVERLV